MTTVKTIVLAMLRVVTIVTQTYATLTESHWQTQRQEAVPYIHYTVLGRNGANTHMD